MTAQEDGAHAGQIIADLYRLEEQLGRGGMGRIWRAEHLRLKSKVAIKFLDPSISDDPETFNRFLREAQSAAAVRSAHVVQTFDCGIDEGTPYISMELLVGESLDKRLFKQSALSPAELDKVFTEVARAVDTAHEFGVIHRDLKPGNIFIARERDYEITKVLDFGIAKLMNVALDVDSASGTRTGTMLGTPYYMSPEQVRGSRSLDQRTDLWSLAIIAFECLTGELPFRGESMGDIVVQICTTQPSIPSEIHDVPAGFDEWFSKGTSKEPSQRFATAGEMAESLSEILARSPNPASRAKSSRGVAVREPATLQSVPVPFGPDAGAPASAPLEAAKSSSRWRSSTTGSRPSSARVPPSPSTRPLTTLIPAPSESSARGGAARARGRWIWGAAPILLLCVAIAAVLWPFAPDREPSITETTTFAAESSGSVGRGEARATAARDPSLGLSISPPVNGADAAVERVTVVSPLARAPVADAPSPVELSSVDAASIDRGTLEQASATRTGSADPDGSQKPSVARQKALRSRSGTTKKPHKTERPRRQAPISNPAAAQPIPIPREAPDNDPFSERR